MYNIELKWIIADRSLSYLDENDPIRFTISSMKMIHIKDQRTYSIITKN